MLKNKRILLILILAIALFLIPSICNAAAITATETTTTSTGKTAKWSYELNGESIVNLKCTNIAEITGELVIPSTIDGHTVVTIGNTKNQITYNDNDGAFEGCNGLTGITIPNTVTKIGSEAFEGCIGLKSVTIPNSVTSIGQYAFYGCSGIASLTLSENLTTIENNAFENCTGLKNLNLPNGVISIGNSAFESCTGLTSLVIPNSVTNIGEQAFRECSGITSLTLSNNITIIRELTFYKCNGLKSVKIPDNVTTIEGHEYSWYGAFAECKNLTKVLIPNSVATIEEGAFLECPKLTIFGNDNQESKRYAEEKNIHFDYIANWDKAAEGADITPPKLESLEIKWESSFEHDKGAGHYLVYADTNITIIAAFDEVVKGKAPTLTIKCGEGENIALNGTVQGKNIVYIYRIQNKDKGIITAVSLAGGDITDEAGNKVEKYTCPELVTDLFDEYVFANGVGSVINNQGSQGNQNGNQQTVTLSSIAITKVPTKTSYKVGESFNKAGMVVTATYSDGSKKEITNYTVSPSTALKLTDKKVVIIYNENGVTKSVEQKITVTAKTINNNNNGSNNSKDDTSKDSTIKNDNKLPQTGATVISLVVITLLAVALISKVRYGKLKDI